MRRYSKQPHLWRTSRRLAKLLTSPAGRTEPSPALPHVHKLKQRLPDETVAALLSDYQNGSSLAELQQTYSLGRSSIQKLLRDGAVRRRRKSLTDAAIAVLVERYMAGLTIREIAAGKDCRSRQYGMRWAGLELLCDRRHDGSLSGTGS